MRMSSSVIHMMMTTSHIIKKPSLMRKRLSRRPNTNLGVAGLRRVVCIRGDLRQVVCVRRSPQMKAAHRGLPPLFRQSSLTISILTLASRHPLIFRTLIFFQIFHVIHGSPSSGPTKCIFFVDVHRKSRSIALGYTYLNISGVLLLLLSYTY